MSEVFFYKNFNNHDLGDDKTPLRGKFNEIIKDLKENNSTSQGNIKLIKGGGNIKCFRAKLSDSDRLLFTSIKHNNKDAFVILEVILNHCYSKSKFLKDREKFKDIEITYENNQEVSDSGTLEIEDASQVCYLGKFITFSAKQEDIVKRVEKLELPLVISGVAGSGKTSVALESLRKIQERFKEGKILCITKSENLVKESKKLFEYEYYDETAGEFKIGAPEKIDFLSLHEFLEKRAGNIKGKKPINRMKFFSWFNEICMKGKFKKYKEDGDKIFEEFTAVIGGGDLLAEDGKGKYAKLGDRQSMFPEDARNKVYDFFKEYKEFIAKDSDYYDPNLIAHECNEEIIYDAIVVDEVQDLTENTLGLVLKSLKDESKSNFLLCGDVNQVIHPSFFSLSKLKSFLCQNQCIRDQGSEVFYNLEKNYRNSEQVIELANRILHLKNYCFASEDKMKEKKKELFFMESETRNTGNMGFIAKGKEEEIAKKINKSVNCAVLVLNGESKEDARKLFDTPLVFNIHEAKGLEFENVVLYKFTSCKAYNEIWNIACPNKSEIDNTINRIRDSYNEREVNTSRNKDKKDKSLERYKFYINALYVGVTRAVDSVYIIDDESNFLKIIVQKKEGNVNIEQGESSPEEWKNMALKLIDEGNVEQAKGIAEKLLTERKEEYAQKIMSVLKAKEKDYTQESQLPLDKNEQAVSELKTEPKKPSMSAYKVPENKKSQGKKHQNEKKKPTEEDLAKNIDKLFFALERSNLKQAKKLIEQGVNVNAKTLKDLTPLHKAVIGNHENIVKLLLKQKEIDVNCRDDQGFTPLHKAVVGNHENIVKLLLKQKEIDVNCNGHRDFTPLHIAAQYGQKNVVELLLQYGADINAKNNEGFTSLHAAAQYGHTDIVELLLENRADVNDKSHKGFTSLRLAAQNGHTDIVKLLLKNRVDVEAKDEKDITPLHLAAQGGHENVVELFLNYQLLKLVEQTAKEVDESKIDNLLQGIEELLKSKTEYDSKPSLNYSVDGNDKNTTIEIAINAGGKLLQLLYDYAEKNISKDTEIFKRLKHAKEDSQSKGDLYDVSISSHLIQELKLG